MTKWFEHFCNIFCRYKTYYIVFLIIMSTIILFYLDKSYTLIPSFATSQFYNTDEHYLEIYNDTVLLNKTKSVLLLWTTFFKSMYWEREIRKTFMTCSKQCEVTSDRTRQKEADAILFHHGDLNKKDLPPFRVLQQPWILFTLEPTTLIEGNMNWWGRIFNWTMSYRTYSTIFSPYGYYVNNSNGKSAEYNNVSYTYRSKDMMAVISRCHDDARRYKIIQELSKHFQVDVYGHCSRKKLKCDYHDKFYCLNPKEIKRYKFRLAFENGYCRDYITEKYWSSLLQDIIPIVNWKEHQNNGHVVPNSYINVYDFTNLTSAIQFIRNISNNESLYNSFYDWKRTYTAVSSMYSGFCQLCDRLHQPFNLQVYKDLEKWFKDDTCGKYNLFDGAFRHIDRYLFNNLNR